MWVNWFGKSKAVVIYMLHCMWAVSEHAHLPSRAVKASLGLWNQLWFSSLGTVTMLLDQVLTIRPTSFLSGIRRHLRCNPLIPHHIQFSVSARPGLCYTSSHWLLFFQFFLCCVVGQHLKRDLALNGNRFCASKNKNLLPFDAKSLLRWPGKLLIPPSQAHGQRASRSFPCTPLGLKPRTFLRSQGPRLGYTSGPSPLG
jgi:hypothetical protein